MAVVVSDTGPASPMCSPAAVQCTPAAVSRSPMAGSPGHWWDRPQPLAMVELCWDALWSRPDENDRAGRPAWVLAWLIRARTWSAGTPCWPVPPPEAGALAVAVGMAGSDGAPPGIGAEADGAAAGFEGRGLAPWPGIRAMPMAPTEQAADLPDPVLAAPSALHR